MRRRHAHAVLLVCLLLSRSFPLATAHKMTCGEDCLRLVMLLDMRRPVGSAASGMCGLGCGGTAPWCGENCHTVVQQHHAYMWSFLHVLELLNSFKAYMKDCM